jgi:hypothetical protein
MFARERMSHSRLGFSFRRKEEDILFDVVFRNSAISFSHIVPPRERLKKCPSS